MDTARPPHPTPGSAFRYWLKPGFISFGGPAGQIALMHQALVEKRRWISEHRYLHALNDCMLLPGPQMMDGLALGETTPGLVESTRNEMKFRAPLTGMLPCGNTRPTS